MAAASVPASRREEESFIRYTEEAEDDVEKVRDITMEKITTLQHLSLKAGLSADAWRKGATFSVFAAIVFGENKTPEPEVG